MIKRKKLNCGISVVMEKMAHVNSVSVGIWVKAGAVNETAENAGISHFIEHMMFKGTEKRSAREIAEDVDNIGGQINAFTGKEATCYYVKTLASNVDKSLEILLDMFTSSLFDPKEIKRERKVIKEEMKMIQDAPDEDAHDTICELVFKNHPLGNSIIGTNKSLNGINHEKIKDYIKNQYTKDSIVVSIAGNFSEAKVCRIIEGKLGGLKARKAKLKYKKEKYAPSFKVKVKDIEQSHICLGTRTIPLEDERYYAFSLLNNIMGGSMSSRFFQNIREQKGLAYSVFSMNSSFSGDGYYNIYAGVSHDKIQEAINAIKEELLDLQENGITKEELKKAKEQLKSSYIFGQENVNGRMFAIGKSSLLLNEIRTPEEVIKEIDAVTMDDIKYAENFICDINNYSGVVVTDKKIPLKKIIQG